MTLLTLLLLAVAIEHLSSLWTSTESEFLDSIKTFFYSMGIGKLTWCRFCQSFWMSGIAVLSFNSGIFHWGQDFGGIMDTMLTWLILHKCVVILIEAFDRYLNRAPIMANVLLHNAPTATEPESAS